MSKQTHSPSKEGSANGTSHHRAAGDREAAPPITARDLWEMILTAEPGSQLDVSKIDPQSAVKATAQLTQTHQQAAPREREDFSLGDHVTAHIDWWGPFAGVFGMARIEIDQVALDTVGAITIPALTALGVSVVIAGIIVAALAIIRATSGGNGVIVYVQIPSLVHYYVPR